MHRKLEEKIGMKLERVPLAFPITPQHNECFDSWLQRLADLHDVTRVDLFRHLGCDEALAAQDLARGKRAVATPQHGGLDHLMDRLAWAVDVDRQRIDEGFLWGGGQRLLPPGLRRFACPVCALGWRRLGLPVIVKREWILRLAWRCHDHGIPLVDLRHVDRVGGASLAWLDRAAGVMAAFNADQVYDEELIALNSRAQERLVSATPGGMSRPVREYVARFGENRLHLASSRTLLLASAHCREPLLLATHELFERRLDAERKRYVSPPVGEPVTLVGLGNDMVTMHRRFAEREQAKLIALQARMRADPPPLLKARARLAQAYGRFRAAWERCTRERAYRERRRVLQADCESMRGRIALECWERGSLAESLRYLEVAHHCRQAAKALSGARSLPSPLVRPTTWGLGMPGGQRVQAMIDARAAALHARARVEGST